MTGMPVADHRPPRRAMLVDGDDAARRSVQLLLQAHGVAVRSFAGVAEALAAHDPRDDLLLAVDRLPDGDGIALLRVLRAGGWTGRALLVTGTAPPTLGYAARAAGYDRILERPLRRHALLAALHLPPGG